jgi:hypothetical protein
MIGMEEKSAAVDDKTYTIIERLLGTEAAEKFLYEQREDKWSWFKLLSTS